MIPYMGYQIFMYFLKPLIHPLFLLYLNSLLSELMSQLFLILNYFLRNNYYEDNIRMIYEFPLFNNLSCLLLYDFYRYFIVIL